MSTSVASQPPPMSTVEPESAQTRPSAAMSFIEHLAELRRRLVICLLTFVATTALGFWQSPWVIHHLQHLAPSTTQFVQLAPGEAFMASFRLAMMVGLALAIPVALYHAIRFVSPGLHAHERKVVFPLAVLSLGLFTAGVTFGYVILLPMMLSFLLGYGAEVAVNTISIAHYLNFTSGFLFASGLVFQLPMVLLALAWIGLITSAQLISQWRWALIASLLASAVITPSADPVSQIALGAGLYGLYGFSWILIKLTGR